MTEQAQHTPDLDEIVYGTTVMDAVREFWRRGYQDKKDKFYQLAKQRILKPDDQGRFTERSIKNCINHPRARLKKPGDADQSVAAKSAEDKAAEELRRIRHQNALLEIDLKAKRGEYISRAQRDRDMAGLAMVLETHLHNMCQMDVSEWVETVLVDPANAEQNLEKAVWASIEAQFHAISKTKQFNVEFTG